MASTDDLSPEESDVGEKRIDRKRIGPKHSKDNYGYKITGKLIPEEVFELEKYPIVPDNTQREYSWKRIPVSYPSLLLIREICPTR